MRRVAATVLATTGGAILIETIERLTSVIYRRPTRLDAVRMRALVRASPPLDVNSTYAYLLVCTHFSDTSVVAERDDQLLGFVSAYLEPADPGVVFIWQVAVAPPARGLGVGRRLLREVLARPMCAATRFLEATTTPSNDASWRLFRALAREHDTRCEIVATFGGAELGGGDHQDEQLLRIGPLAADRQGGT
jgi:L-2,4-diaminobutyric acid acetyltransferase